MLWALVSPSLIVHKHECMSLCARVCKWMDRLWEEDRMQTMGLKPCIKLQLSMLHCVLHCCLLGAFGGSIVRLTEYLTILHFF